MIGLSGLNSPQHWWGWLFSAISDRTIVCVCVRVCVLAWVRRLRGFRSLSLGDHEAIAETACSDKGGEAKILFSATSACCTHWELNLQLLRASGRRISVTVDDHFSRYEVLSGARCVNLHGLDRSGSVTARIEVGDRRRKGPIRS